MTTNFIAAAALFVACSRALAAEPAETKLVKPEGGRCAFEATSKLVHASYQEREGDTRTLIQLDCHDRKATRCQLRYFDIPPAANKMSLAELAKLGGLPTWTKPGALQKTRDVSFQGIKGEEYSVDRLPYADRVRVFATGGRAYIISASFPPAKKGEETEREIASFLDSFQMSDK